MLKKATYGPVTRFDLARSIAGRGHYWTTAYLVDGTLIDTGCAHSASELEQELQGITIDRILNTHSHEDHIGANAILQNQRDGLEILAHPLALPVLADPRCKQPLEFYRRFFWGWPDPSKGKLLPDGDTVESENYCFQVFHTPGHSRDHLCLYEPDQGWLFTGDLYVGGKDRGLRIGGDIWGIIASLKRIAPLKASTMFPGSARVRENPTTEITTKIEYYESFGERVLNLNSQGHSVEEIVNELCGGPMLIEWFTLGHFSRRHLMQSYLGI